MNTEKHLQAGPELDDLIGQWVMGWGISGSIGEWRHYVLADNRVALLNGLGMMSSEPINAGFERFAPSTRIDHAQAVAAKMDLPITSPLDVCRQAFSNAMAKIERGEK